MKCTNAGVFVHPHGGNDVSEDSPIIVLGIDQFRILAVGLDRA